MKRFLRVLVKIITGIAIVAFSMCAMIDWEYTPDEYFYPTICVMIVCLLWIFVILKIGGWFDD